MGERVSGLRDPPCRAQQRPSRVLTLTEASGCGTMMSGTHWCISPLFFSNALKSCLSRCHSVISFILTVMHISYLNLFLYNCNI